jgi:hypothetical protein
MSPPWAAEEGREPKGLLKWLQEGDLVMKVWPLSRKSQSTAHTIQHSVPPPYLPTPRLCFIKSKTGCRPSKRHTGFELGSSEQPQGSFPWGAAPPSKAPTAKHLCLLSSALHGGTTMVPLLGDASLGSAAVGLSGGTSRDEPTGCLLQKHRRQNPSN